MKPENVERQLRELTLRDPGPGFDDRIRRSIDRTAKPPMRGMWRMPERRYLAAAAPIAIVMMLGLLYMLVGLPTDAPSIQFEQEHIDLGMLPEEGIASMMIGVSNTGKSPLEIDRVTTTCGCTLATFEQFIVLPGQKTNMIVTIDPAKVKHPYGTKQLIVFSNDPARPEAQLEVSAQLMEPMLKSIGYIN